MLKHTLLLLFLYGIKWSTGRPQNDVAEAREEIQRDRIKKSEVGANGSGTGSEQAVLWNFRNPVLEYLLNQGRVTRDDTKQVVREITHGQTLFLPRQSFPATFPGPIPSKDPGGRPMRDPEKEPITNFYDFLHGLKGPQKFVTSPVLQLNKSQTEWTKTERFPAEVVVVSSYNADGTIKSSVTHFHPMEAPTIGQYAVTLTSPNMQGPNAGQRISWPFAGYFPIVINDPFLAAYNGFTTGMYNTFSSMIEYGPDADICRGKITSDKVKDNRKDKSDFDEVTLDAEVKLIKPKTEKPEAEERMKRSARDTTEVLMKFKNGESVNFQVEGPKPNSNILLPAEAEERTRAHSVMLVNPPPLSSIARPSHTGFSIKKKGSKPHRPDKEGNEGGSEEVGEEVEDSTTQGNAADGVAVSPPPDGASVAEAKPVGLAIAGPGGVAAAKPQGTAVAGPGGLAIARPIGTAIAGVQVEGAVPIGGQQKNKNKKPKQDPEKMDDETDTELHYVGGLTGPIGNPQPNTKDFGKGSSAVKARTHDNVLIQGNQNDGYQLKLGEQAGKYGFFPVASPPKERIQKRMDSPTFFHGLLGHGHIQVPQSHIYPNFYY